jgi:nucleoside diphosphate kinase
MRCLVGILVSLRVEHKGFSIEENKYLKELMNNFDNQYPEHFNEIYELLASITAKLNEEPTK